MPLTDCCVRPLDSCCPCCIKVDEDTELASCICAWGEPVRRCFDLRQAVRRPFYVCMIFGCVLMLMPATVMTCMMLWSFIQGTELYKLTMASTDCQFVAVWGGVEIVLSVCNFVFTWFLFHKLRRSNEERDFLYRRDMGELYARYQSCGEESIRLEMLGMYTSYRDSLKNEEKERKKVEADIAELQEKRAKQDDSLFDTDESKKQARSERRKIDLEIKKLEFKAVESQSGLNTASLLEMVYTLARTQRQFMIHVFVILISFIWSIAGAMYLRNVACKNSQLMFGTRLLVYGSYIFVVMGFGCCFCNIFAAAEISYASHGAIMAGDSEVEQILKDAPREEV